MRLLAARRRLGVRRRPFDPALPHFPPFEADRRRDRDLFFEDVRFLEQLLLDEERFLERLRLPFEEERFLERLRLLFEEERLLDPLRLPFDADRLLDRLRPPLEQDRFRETLRFFERDRLRDLPPLALETERPPFLDLERVFDPPFDFPRRDVERFLRPGEERDLPLPPVIGALGYCGRRRHELLDLLTPSSISSSPSITFFGMVVDFEPL